MKNMSKSWLMVLLFQTLYRNKIPIEPKDLGSPLVTEEQMAYCSAYFFCCINVTGIREMINLLLLAVFQILKGFRY